MGHLIDLELASTGRRSSEKPNPFSSTPPPSNEDTAALAVLESSQSSTAPARRRYSYRMQLPAESSPSIESSIPVMISVRNRSSSIVDDSSSRSGASPTRRSKKSKQRSVKKKMSQLRNEALQEEGEILPLSELASKFLDFAAGGCEDESQRIADIARGGGSS
jgi:hypothetical protein